MDDTMTKDEKKKKKGLVLIISVGGKPPKAPKDTADPDTKKKGILVRKKYQDVPYVKVGGIKALKEKHGSPYGDMGFKDSRQMNTDLATQNIIGHPINQNIPPEDFPMNRLTFEPHTKETMEEEQYLSFLRSRYLEAIKEEQVAAREQETRDRFGETESTQDEDFYGKVFEDMKNAADPDDKKKGLPHQMMDMGRFASLGLPPEVLGYGAAAGLGLAASGYGMAALDSYLKRRQLEKLGYTPETHPQYFQEQN